MSLPNEEVRSLIYMRQFLSDMLDPKKMPGIPKAVRREAYYRIKHAPMGYRLKELLKAEFAKMVDEYEDDV